MSEQQISDRDVAVGQLVLAALRLIEAYDDEGTGFEDLGNYVDALETATHRVQYTGAVS